MTKVEPVIKRTFLMRILGGYNADHPIFADKLSIPEATIFQCFKTLIDHSNPQHKLLIKELDSDGLSLTDSVYSDVPCLLFGNKRVQKHNILVFLKKMTTINDKFRKEPGRASEEKIKRLEVMC